MTTTTRALALAASLIVLAGCDDKPVNGKHHPKGDAWGKKLHFAIEAAPWQVTAFVVLLLVAVVAHAHRPRRYQGRHTNKDHRVRVGTLDTPRCRPQIAA